LQLVALEISTIFVDPEKHFFKRTNLESLPYAGHKNRTIIQQCWSNLSKNMIINGKYNDFITQINTKYKLSKCTLF
jgi:hypothetical protein